MRDTCLETRKPLLPPSLPRLPMGYLFEQADLHEVEEVRQALRLLRPRRHHRRLEHRGVLLSRSPGEPNERTEVWRAGGFMRDSQQ